MGAAVKNTTVLIENYGFVHFFLEKIKEDKVNEVGRIKVKISEGDNRQYNCMVVGDKRYLKNSDATKILVSKVVVLISGASFRGGMWREMVTSWK